MKLIVDAGATQADWCLLSPDGIKLLNTVGWNPNSGTFIQFEKEVVQKFADWISEIDTLHFYGAGVASEDRAEVVKGILKSIFSDSEIHVRSDLTASARAAFGKEHGMIGVLGTGAALGECVDGEIVRRVPSLGYVLGDEGSGFYLAKTFIAALLRGQVPEEVKKAFLFKFPDFDELRALDIAYKEDHPNRVIAGFCEFLSMQQKHPYVYQMVYDGLRMFFKSMYNNDPRLMDLKWRFTGSIAHHFDEMLRKVGSEKDLYIDMVLQSPMDDLIKYHQQYG
ncbi:hypothetical protein [Marinoscillum sp. MHG1-6]|uniref:hypothetical protein n=1 Tax=Marinoscillum sp. MHG1-6 TaxID=2959627 RepID=UPI002157264B|nr:hypothetical protein [Marinoscillum sp. MHG1-6]